MGWLIALSVVVLVGSLVHRRIHPTKIHRKCLGEGEIVTKSGAVRRCWHCGGTGRLERWFNGR